MNAGLVASRWARALLRTAVSENKIESFLTELEAVSSLLNRSSDLRVLMTDPVFAIADRQKLIDALVLKKTLSVLVGHFLKLLVEKDRFCFLDAIVRSYQEQADQALGYLRVYLTTDVELSSDDRQILKTALEKKTQKKIVLEEKIDPDVLGGFVLRVQDFLYDGTLRAMLQGIKANLTVHLPL